MALPIGEMLIRKSLLTEVQLRSALQHQDSQGGRLGSILSHLGYVSDEDSARVLSYQHGVPWVDLRYLKIDRDTTRLIPRRTAIRHQVLPLLKVGMTLVVAIIDPRNVIAVDEIKFITGLRTEPVVATESSIQSALEEYYGTEQTLEIKRVYEELASTGEYELELTSGEPAIDLTKFQHTEDEAPIVKLVNLIMADAVRKGASDIHLETYEGEFRVRYRIDGVLYGVMTPPYPTRDAIVSRIKVMGDLDISERRLPQDGRIRVCAKTSGRRKQIDLRVSTVPTLFGEKIVLRILDRENLPLDFGQLGLEPDSLRRLLEAIRRPHGMVLVTGPTGSGKTSTLYTCLNQLNTPTANLMTVEDPIEFHFPGINQVQTKERVGLTFATALRAFLRQDPDIIMVGEIRDLDTAEIAITAALTGHLVLSTLHTNDASSAVNRLLDMAVEPYLIANSVHLLCAQRLVRKICNHCKNPIKTPATSLAGVGFPKSVAQELISYRGKGCQQFPGSGYRGRTGLFEVMEITESIQRLILSGASTIQIREEATREGMVTLRQSGLAKIRSGITTLEEVLRETE